MHFVAFKDLVYRLSYHIWQISVHNLMLLDNRKAWWMTGSVIGCHAQV